MKGDRLRREQEEDLKNLEEEMKEGGYESWEDFMRKWKEHLSRCLSPLRTADIGDLIVEVDSRYLEEDCTVPGAGGPFIERRSFYAGDRR